MDLEKMELPIEVSGKNLADYLEVAFEEFAEEKGYRANVHNTSKIKPGIEEVGNSREVRIIDLPNTNHVPHSTSLIKISVGVDLDEKYKEIEFSKLGLNKKESFELAEKVYDQFD